MIKLGILFVILMINPVFSAEQIFEPFVNGFAGLNTKFSSHKINDNQMVTLDNCLIDEDRAVINRGGTWFTKELDYNDGIKLMHVYEKPDGTKEMVVISSRTIAVTQDLTTFTVLISSIPANAICWAVNFSSLCFIGTNNGDRWYYDGTNIKLANSIPQVRYMITAYDRLIGANSNTTDQQSRVLYSDIGYVFKWDSSLTGNWIEIDRNNGNPLTAIFVFKGNIYATKYNRFYVISGLEDSYNQNDFFHTTINNVGCLFNENIKENQGLIYFVSLRGVETFDGNSTEIISYPIDNLITAAKQIDNYLSVDFSTCPIVGIIYNDQYWVSVSTTSGDKQKITYVYDKIGQWSRFTVLQISAACVYKDELYLGMSYNGVVGDNNYAPGTIVKYDTSITYDFTNVSNIAGSGGETPNISPELKTKSFDFGSYNNLKRISVIWLNVASNLGFFYTGTVTVSAFKNMLTTAVTTYVFTANPETYYTNVPLRLKWFTEINRVTYLSFSITNFSKFYGIKIKYEIIPDL